MAIQFQLRRGTTVQNNAFVGAEGEITVDTEKHAIRIHDGVTPGGYTQDFVTESWISDDGLSWYRKYSSGWIEQGGQWTHAKGTLYLTLPVAMVSNEFSVIGSYGKDYSASNNNNFALFAYSTTQICLQDNNTGTMIWQVSGVAA